MKALLLTLLLTASSVSAQPAGPPSTSPAQPINSSKVLKIELSIPAPVHDVWAALTTQQGLSSWLAPDVSVELKPGGDWLVKFPRSTGGGTIVSFVPEKEIVIDALAPDRFPQVRATRTRAVFTFMAEGNSTLVRLSQTGWQSGSEWDAAVSTSRSETPRCWQCCTIALWPDRPTGKRPWRRPQTNPQNNPRRESMNGHLNYWAILVAAVSLFVLGGLWYKVFSAPWQKANGFESEPPADNPAKVFGVSFLFSLVMAFNLAKFLDSPATTAAWGATAGFLAGFGWCFMGIGNVCLFERKPWSYRLRFASV